MILLNVVAYRAVDYKMGSILAASGYLFVMLLGAVFLQEAITRRKIVGNLLIVGGSVFFAVMTPVQLGWVMATG